MNFCCNPLYMLKIQELQKPNTIYTIMSVYTAHGLRHFHKNIFLYERNDSLLETPSNASMQEG